MLTTVLLPFTIVNAADEHHFFRHPPPTPDGVIIITVDNSTAASPSTQPPSPSAAATAAEPVSRTGSEESLIRQDATVLKHGFWGLVAIGAVTGLCGGFLTGATGGRTTRILGLGFGV